MPCKDDEDLENFVQNIKRLRNGEKKRTFSKDSLLGGNLPDELKELKD